MSTIEDLPGSSRRALHLRWLGTVTYCDAHALQHGLFEQGSDDWILLLEHPHVFTVGARGDLGHVLVDPEDVGAVLVKTDRGGDVTYHGPGQLVGYPILTLPGKRGGGMTDTVAYVRSVEQLVIDTLADVGLPGAGRLRDYPGVWIEPGSSNPRKIAAIGVRLDRRRSMHGFALNVDPDMSYFSHIVPCGIPDKAVTSIREEGMDVSMREVVDALARRAIQRWAQVGDETTQDGNCDRADVVWNHRPEDLSPFTRGARSGAGSPQPPEVSVALGADTDRGAPTPRRAARLEAAGVTSGLSIHERKPPWLRVNARMDAGYRWSRRTIHDLDLVTVCEEAGCPNIFECWSDGTATFMINGDRCTRACGFCLVDTRHPEPLDASEPERVAEAVQRMGLTFAVITAVARDDLADGGARAFADTVDAIRKRTPETKVEVLIPDCKGSDEALAMVFATRPDVMNHNLETVARLQRAVRPSAGYARSLSVLARAKAAGLRTKSGLVVGMGETFDEVVSALADLRGVGTDIVTIGQYLRPTASHLPVARWVPPAEFDQWRRIGERELGIGHIEASPLTRSSYHAKHAAGEHR